LIAINAIKESVVDIFLMHLNFYCTLSIVQQATRWIHFAAMQIAMRTMSILD